MKALFVVFLLTFSILLFSAVSDTLFFYLYLEWPGSRCNTKEGCCFPKTVKRPAKDFVISGYQPVYFSGNRPTHCNSHKLNISTIADMTKRLEKHWPSLTCPSPDSKKLWSNEWSTYGTCAESLDQREYFEMALRFKRRANLLKVLKNGGIQPNGSTYSTNTIREAIIAEGLHLPGLVCEKDKYGNDQLSKVLLCVTGNKIQECPGGQFGMCGNSVKFPRF